MPRTYVKKEKKIIRYKDDSLNDRIHKLLSLFDDVSQEILMVKVNTKRTLQNTLSNLNAADKVKPSKILVNKYLFRTYHYTDTFKEQLFLREPENYPQFSTIEKRKVNAINLSRATKISDSMCMGMMAD